MTLLDFFKTLSQARVSLKLVDGTLRVDAPKGAVTPALLAELKARKQDLIAYLSSADKRQARIEPAARTERLPLSYTQQRLWLLDQIDDTSAHYHIPSALKLSGRLDVDALTRALETVVLRHESLRTVFASDADGQPYQRIRNAPSFEIALVDLSPLMPEEQATRLRQEAQAEAVAPFDLARDLMLRARLLRLAPEVHVLLVTMHHIASDGWSMAILVNEFTALYGAYSQGQANPLAPLAIQYADYAYWQRNWLQGEVLDAQIGYWERQLAGLPAVHSLPLDHPRPAVQGFAGRRLVSHIDKPASDALAALAQAHGATLFMAVHAAFAVLLARYSNEADIVVGTAVANREQPEIAGLIGFFVNTLVLRSDVRPELTFAELLAQSRAMLLDAYAHQQVPFEQIVERLQPERSLAHGPLFQVMLTMQNNEEGVLELPGLTLEGIAQEATVAQYELSLDVQQGEAGLVLAWEYNTDLFEARTIERMSGHFAALVEAMTAHPDSAVLEVPMVGVHERTRLLREFNATAADYPTGICIQSLFESQAARQGDVVALRCGDQHLTYAELDARANALAHWLRSERGVGPDRLVGLCLERSLDMVVAILAILKAGGAYVPLDPAYPVQRLAYMLDDAGLDTVLTHAYLLAQVPVSAQQAVCLDDPALRQAVAACPATALASAAIGLTPANLAYVIYTSGSTGNPKGVMITHASLVNMALDIGERYGLTPRDRFLQFAPISFDMSVEDIFTALSSGCTLVLRGEDWIDSAQRFWQRCTEQGVTVLNLPTAFWHELVRSGAIPGAGVRHVTIGGEKVSAAMIAAWFTLPAPLPRLLNSYGPTESTVNATFVELSPTVTNTIGSALHNTMLCVLNARGQLAPVGVGGELLIGGAGLARGYLNRPELTAEKFIANPYHDPAQPGSSERLYRTGDLVRWLEDGKLEFLGRIDHQVKIRGFRVELGEIEAALAAHEQVDGALVLAHRGEGDDLRLVAYVIGTVEPEALHAHLAERLPAYMIPATIMRLDAWPLTPNGKVDRKALPAPQERAVRHDYVPPQTASEAILCDILAQTLGIGRIGITDNIFEMGVHSLMALQAAAKIRQATGVEIALRQLFVRPTVRELAQLLDGHAQFAHPGNLVQLKPGNPSRRQPLFLVHPGEGEIGYARVLAGRLDGELPVYGLAAKGLLAGESPILGVPEMAADYLRAIRAVQPNGPYRLAGWSAGGTIAYEMARQLQAAGCAVSFLGLIDTMANYRDMCAELPPESGNADVDDAALLLMDVRERHPQARFLDQWSAWSSAGDIEAMIDSARREGVFPRELDTATVRRHVAVRAAITRSLARYVRPAAALKVSLFLAMEERPDLTLGWGTEQGCECEIMAIGGTHYSIVEEPYVGRLAKAVAAALARNAVPAVRPQPHLEVQ